MEGNIVRFDSDSGKWMTKQEYIEDGLPGLPNVDWWEEKFDTLPQYNSAPDTLRHIKRVNELLSNCAIELLERGKNHDSSKLERGEREYFDRVGERLKGLEYGSDEYKASLKELEPALEHHYANNPHHPEHYEDGVDSMNLFDVLEMLVDWKAAGERHDTGSIFKSLEYNKVRFSISPQLLRILENTANYIGWEGEKPIRASLKNQIHILCATGNQFHFVISAQSKFNALRLANNHLLEIGGNYQLSDNEIVCVVGDDGFSSERIIQFISTQVE